MVIFPLAPDQTIAQMWSREDNDRTTDLFAVSDGSCPAVVHSDTSLHINSKTSTSNSSPHTVHTVFLLSQ